MPISYVLLAKIVGILIILSTIVGGVVYVRNLQKTNTEQSEQIIDLDRDKKALEQTLEDNQEFDEARDIVSQGFEPEREQNRVIRDNRQAVINQNVTEGNDRPVGKILQDYFNEE